MRLIDADELRNELTSICSDKVNDYNKAVKGFIEFIDNAPTVEPQKIVTIPPELIEKLASCVVDIVGNIDWEKAIEAYKARPQGEWQLHGMIYYCSECGHECGESGDNFCGNCGADMRGGKQ